MTKNPPLKLLIADDDITTRIYLKRLAMVSGYEVVEAEDGRKAWEILQSPDTPRIAILDWLMPEMTALIFAADFGNPAAQKIKKNLYTAFC